MRVLANNRYSGRAGHGDNPPPVRHRIQVKEIKGKHQVDGGDSEGQHRHPHEGEDEQPQPTADKHPFPQFFVVVSVADPVDDGVGDAEAEGCPVRLPRCNNDEEQQCGQCMHAGFEPLVLSNLGVL